MLQSDAPKKLLSPLEAVRKYCLECMGGHRGLVAACVDTACPFHPLRQKIIPEGFSLRIIRVVRRFCLRCTMGDREAVRRCTEHERCPVWHYRIGVSPRRLKRRITEKRRPKQLGLPF